MTIYEKIIKLRELNEVFKKENFNSEFTQLIDDVATYADDCYVSDAEDMGYEILSNVEIIEERSYETGKKDAVEKFKRWFIKWWELNEYLPLDVCLKSIEKAMEDSPCDSCPTNEDYMNGGECHCSKIE